MLSRLYQSMASTGTVFYSLKMSEHKELGDPGAKLSSASHHQV